MKRISDQYLQAWRDEEGRMPLLLRGARQVGKTYAVRELGKTFTDFVEVNIEFDAEARKVFERSLDPEKIILDLSLITGKTITPGKTLLFIDEIQTVPQAVLSLRYFYEKLPDLHVVAAGSLLDFAIEEVGIPVGRVQLLHMYPLSFLEFLLALDEKLLAKEILNHPLNEKMSEVVHEKLLKRVAEYQALGGMPKIVKCWKEKKNPRACGRLISSIVRQYRLDFVKYGKKYQIKYLELLFKEVPRQLGKKFQYSSIEGDFRKRELSPALDLLETAGLVHKVQLSTCQGLPLGAEIDPHDFKAIFLDVGLAQGVLKLNIADWFLYPIETLINKGHIGEAFVGQEMLAYSDPFLDHELFYWRRESPATAEIDYVIQDGNLIVPVEVKSGPGTTLRSLHIFLETHKQTQYGIRFSTHNYYDQEMLRSYPLYAVASVIAQLDSEVKIMLENLMA